ncbi:hypothetical protein [Rhodopseudomonas palustris]|uniref:hypothetical protein n=1 Tax=Rhodopseudomonas palustris TaxID=1076 RepID=UPI000E5C3590|nr:hypothetical protein [Rhodopseudomonas palustris]QLH71293.1 hypothetical protein HZF03_11035 [Rhodopseudomonas palustris]RHZ93610.1 hypothetical protein D1920_20690 [Rhodopseudomonas palustris]
MKAITRNAILEAKAGTPWDTCNKILYELCERYPAHTDRGAVVAKILIIGRAYAAAIERRKNKTAADQNDDFYLTSVAPAVMNSEIDQWLREARAATPGTQDGSRTLLMIHGKVTELFSRISDLEKRSLASKYLHFHVPQLFYIYDTRAVKAMRHFAYLVPRASRTDGTSDHEYRKFVEKCAHLVAHIRREFGLKLSPRQLDNLLLASLADKSRATR